MSRRKTLPAKAKGQPVLARYDAAGQGRRWKGMLAPASGPNTAIKPLDTIRNRARDITRNSWAGQRSVQQWATTLIGIGITPRFKRVKSEERRQFLTDLWSDFGAECDADGVLGIYGLQTLVTRTWFDAGECFIRRRPRTETFGTRLPLQIQVIEPDFCPLIDFDAEPRLPAGNTVRMGIERDKRGQRTAYWFYRDHPGDKPSGVIQTSTLLRIPASDVIHVFEPARPGQLRGVSNTAPILTRLRTIDAYDDNVMTRMQLANLMVGFIKSSLPNGPDDGTNPLSGLPYEQSGGEPLATLEPGIMQELDPGQEVQWSNPPEAGTDYSAYMRTQHMGTASGQGLPYELFSGDISNVSDRTLRVVMQEFRRFAEQRQWQIIIPQMCQRVINWFAEAALLAGEISPAELDSVRRVEHAPHGWEYLHPVQDVQGKQLEVEAGFRSRSSVISAKGDDPEATDRERQADDEREEALGLKPDPADAAKQQQDQQDQQQKQTQALLDELTALRAQADRLQAAVDARVVASGRPALKIIKRDPVTGLIAAVEDVAQGQA